MSCRYSCLFMSMWLFVILCINVKACPHERSLIAGQTVLPDDNRSFDDVGSVGNTGSYLVDMPLKNI